MDKINIPPAVVNAAVALLSPYFEYPLTAGLVTDALLREITRRKAYSETTAPDALLTIKQVATILGCSTRTVSRYVERGQLIQIKLEMRSVRIRQSELDRFIDSGS